MARLLAHRGCPIGIIVAWLEVVFRSSTAMIICSCNVISDHDVRSLLVSAEAKFCSTAQVYDCLGCFVQCGQCARFVRGILDEGRPQLPTIPCLPDAGEAIVA